MGQDEEGPLLERTKDPQKKGQVMPAVSGRRGVRAPVVFEGRRLFARRETGGSQVCGEQQRDSVRTSKSKHRSPAASAKKCSLNCLFHQGPTHLLTQGHWTPRTGTTVSVWASVSQGVTLLTENQHLNVMLPNDTLRTLICIHQRAF